MQKEKEFVEIQIELPPVEVAYTSEEEDLSFTGPSKRMRTPASGLHTGESHLSPDDRTSEAKEKTPNDHRRRVKFQKLAASRRFTSTYQMLGSQIMNMNVTGDFSPSFQPEDSSIHQSPALRRKLSKL